jgi:hypothetical protein
MTQMLAPKPSRLLENAICVPSGDQTGEEAVARSRVSLCERALTTSMMYRSVMPARPLTYAIKDCPGFATGLTSASAASERTDAGVAVGSTPWQAMAAPLPRRGATWSQRAAAMRR